MDDRLGGRHDHDEIGLHEGAIDARFGAVGESERDEIGIGRVVDDHAPAEVPCLRRRQQALELASPESTAETAGDEDRLTLVGDAERRQLVEHGRERVGSRIDLRAGQRERSGLDHDGDATAFRHQSLERRARERKAQRIPHRRLDVDDARRRSGRVHDHVLVADRDVDDARAGENRDAAPRRQSTTVSRTFPGRSRIDSIECRRR